MLRRSLLAEKEIARVDHLLDGIMGKGKHKKAQQHGLPKKRGLIIERTARAPAHPHLMDAGIHVFVDDQNLFWGITNDPLHGPSYRMDFGRLLLETAKGPDGRARPVRSAYIAGVVPDDDYFWEVARNQGFQVRRGYLGTNNRSKQDDAYLITEIMETLYEKDGPSTVILVAGDADYVGTYIRA